MAEIDIDVLITLVHDRPILWDKTKENYKDKILSRNAWIEVFKELNAGFEEKEEKERNDYGKYTATLIFYFFFYNLFIFG